MPKGLSVPFGFGIYALLIACGWYVSFLSSGASSPSHRCTPYLSMSSNRTPSTSGVDRFPNLLAASLLPTFRLNQGPFPPPALPGFKQYCGPFRHPIAPGASLAGLRLILTPITSWGFPCRIALRYTHAIAIAPTEQPGAFVARCPGHDSLPPSHEGSASVSSISRSAQRSLLVTAYVLARSLWTLFTGGFSRFVTSTTAPIATGWSDSCRTGLPPAGSARVCTAHMAHT